MSNYTCKSCGVQHAANTQPETCQICARDDLYIHDRKQQWLSPSDHYNQHQAIWQHMETGLTRLSITPKIAIGQDAYLVQTQNGNYLWDCVPLINQQIIDDIKTRGGLKAIAISHPHFYANMADWSAAFGDIPIYIHKNDQQWVPQPSDNIIFWQGDILQLEDDLTLIKCGGHYAGSTALHWAGTADNKALLLGSDTIAPWGAKNAVHATFMRNFNLSIPLPAHKVAHIGKTIAPFKFDRLYGSFKMNIMQNADIFVQQSVHAYVKALE